MTFVTKPVSSDELRARLRAGQRILSMRSELVEKNRVIAANMEELQKLYDSLDRDLIEARKLQQTLVRERHRDFGRAAVSADDAQLGPCRGRSGRVVPDRRPAHRAYSVDVSGMGLLRR
jgi:sigma-B regulation protein RsbU (phosphoserine phosphatase)